MGAVISSLKTLRAPQAATWGLSSKLAVTDRKNGVDMNNISRPKRSVKLVFKTFQEMHSFLKAANEIQKRGDSVRQNFGILRWAGSRLPNQLKQRGWR